MCKLKGTPEIDIFCQMLLYFVQSQSYGDNQTNSTSSSPSTNFCILEGGFCNVVQDIADLEIHHLCHVVVFRHLVFLAKQILVLVVYIWTIEVLVLFTLLSHTHMRSLIQQSKNQNTADKEKMDKTEVE